MARPLPFDVTPDKIKKIETLWPEINLTIREIAEMSGVTYQWLQRYYVDIGLSSRGWPTPRAPDDPTPAEIRSRARECRRIHFAKKKQEVSPIDQERQQHAYKSYVMENM